MITLHKASGHYDTTRWIRYTRLEGFISFAATILPISMLFIKIIFTAMAAAMSLGLGHRHRHQKGKLPFFAG